MANEDVSVDQFLQATVKSGLLTRERLQEVLADIPEEVRGNAKGLADHFVEIDLLSTFQAQKLLKGASIGLVLGPYHLVTPIGRGGMGTVYLARDTRNDRSVALKILPPRRAREEERMLARFQREMEISRRVSHPHLAHTYDAGEYHKIHFIAMEYIPGTNLYQRVVQRGPLSVGEAARLFAQIASGLEHAHNQGVIHRDLKPSNIMITPAGHAKVLDLGLALIEGEVHHDARVVGGKGYVVGSMDYIAPEQTRDPVGVDGRADVYGLGCTLYFALTSQPPFPGGTAKEKMRKHREVPPRPLRELVPVLPDGFTAVVEKMMAKKRSNRYPTAYAAHKALLQWTNAQVAIVAQVVDDSTVDEAVKQLQHQEVSEEYVEEPILGNTIDSSEDPTDQNELPGWVQFDDEPQGWGWLVLAFVTFWAGLILVIVLLALFRS
ncbi:MAG: serine/threonine-protein kinase [Gemmataceae bacterium]